MMDDTSRENESSNELSDDQVNAAFADLEKQFSDDFGHELDENLTDNYSLDPAFEAELDGIIGNKAKIAIIITNLASAHFLAALCRVMDVDARAVRFTTGAGALLADTQGSAPEDVAHALSESMSGLFVVLCVNRADKISITQWFNGQNVQKMAPPMFFNVLDPTIEDLMIGSQTPADLDMAGYEQVESSDFATEDEAMEFIRQFMKTSDNEQED
ncbi:hypothetical protein [Alloscardovia omnicolens]|uniref:hypothetical protein n=1 Tax=Alloscardovia omnicolens TaxID=419015 RepID=UPI003A66835E